MEDIGKIFRLALKSFTDNNKVWGFKSKISRDAGILPQELNDYITGRGYGTEEKRRAIAAACGYPNRLYEDFLDIGRAIDHGKDSVTIYNHVKTQSFTKGLSPQKTKALEAYRDLLFFDSEGVEVITNSIMTLARKKLSKTP